MLLLIAFGAFVLACLVNYFYWKPLFEKLREQAKADAEAHFNKLGVTEKALKDHQKSLYRSVEICGKLKGENIKLKEILEGEKQWIAFLNEG